MQVFQCPAFPLAFTGSSSSPVRLQPTIKPWLGFQACCLCISHHLCQQKTPSASGICFRFTATSRLFVAWKTGRLLLQLEVTGRTPSQRELSLNVFLSDPCKYGKQKMWLYTHAHMLTDLVWVLSTEVKSALLQRAIRTRSTFVCWFLKTRCIALFSSYVSIGWAYCSSFPCCHQISRWKLPQRGFHLLIAFIYHLCWSFSTSLFTT